MKKLAACAVLILAAIAVTLARGGHEFPVYPGYYPHEIRIETISPDRAPELLRTSKIQAYIGNELVFGSRLPDSIGRVESLGSFLVVRINPNSPFARDEPSACAVTRAVIRELASRGDGVKIHPYPVTPFHGDYLDYVDLADAAKNRLLADATSASPQLSRRLKVRVAASPTKNLVRSDWITEGTDWDAELEEVSAAGLVTAATTQVNGWIGPPWLRTGWFQAVQLLLPVAGNPRDNDRARADLQRLQSGAYQSIVERINLERDLVSAVTASCRALVAGYTVKRQYLSTDYSAGIENIAFDSLTGLESPIFIRTAKLKDFPWNGWLSLGIATPPTAAWNPIAGFTDQFGSLMWSAVGDPAALPSPDDAGWMLNRISDVRAAPTR
jgi:hypothetical protein